MQQSQIKKKISETIKRPRIMKSLIVLATVLIWATVAVLVAAPAEQAPNSCAMMKGLDLSADQQVKIQELCKAHRAAVRALLNDEQKVKFDAMAGHMHRAMTGCPHDAKVGACMCPCCPAGHEHKGKQ